MAQTIIDKATPKVMVDLASYQEQSTLHNVLSLPLKEETLELYNITGKGGEDARPC